MAAGLTAAITTTAAEAVKSRQQRDSLLFPSFRLLYARKMCKTSVLPSFGDSDAKIVYTARWVMAFYQRIKRQIELHKHGKRHQHLTFYLFSISSKYLLNIWKALYI